MRVLVQGHSFVVSFKDHLKHIHKTTKSDLPFSQFVAHQLKVADHVEEIHLIGKSGGKILENIDIPIRKLQKHKPTIVILDVGSNDAAKNKYDNENIVFQIMAHAEALRNLYSVKCVIICSLINRDIGMDMTPAAFQRRVYAINDRLITRTAREPAIRYHQHRGFARTVEGAVATCSNFSFDGIHPNKGGKQEVQKVVD
jgi:lysophospholipase L1-like esterase